jgi:zona occludens toxin
MIWGLVGRPGGGKSYRTVQLILEALAKGRAVVTNIPLTIQNDLIYSWDWDYLQPEKTASLLQSETQDKPLEYPKGALYLLDECWRGFQSGSRLDQLGERCLAFFKEHRHRVNEAGIADDIVLITQDLGDIPNAIRSLCEQTILCEKPADIGIKNMSVRYYMTGAVKGLQPNHKLVIKTERETLKPEVYNHYKSNTQSSSSGSALEGSAIESTFWQSTKFKFMVFGMVSALGAMGVAAWHLKTKTLPKYQNVEASIGNRPAAGKHPQSAPAQLSGQAASTSQTVKAPEKTAPYESTRWRVVAWWKSLAKGDAIFIQDRSGRNRRVNNKDCRWENGTPKCIIEGEIITIWSGPYTGTNLSAGVTMAADKVMAPPIKSGG